MNSSGVERTDVTWCSCNKVEFDYVSKLGRIRCVECLQIVSVNIERSRTFEPMTLCRSSGNNSIQLNNSVDTDMNIRTRIHKDQFVDCNIDFVARWRTWSDGNV